MDLFQPVIKSGKQISSINVSDWQKVLTFQRAIRVWIARQDLRSFSAGIVLDGIHRHDKSKEIDRN